MPVAIGPSLVKAALQGPERDRRRHPPSGRGQARSAQPRQQRSHLTTCIRDRSSTSQLRVARQVGHQITTSLGDPIAAQVTPECIRFFPGRLQIYSDWALLISIYEMALDPPSQLLIRREGAGFPWHQKHRNAENFAIVANLRNHPCRRLRSFRTFERQSRLPEIFAALRCSRCMDRNVHRSAATRTDFTSRAAQDNGSHGRVHPDLDRQSPANATGIIDALSPPIPGLTFDASYARHRKRPTSIGFYDGSLSALRIGMTGCRPPARCRAPPTRSATLASDNGMPGSLRSMRSSIPYFNTNSLDATSPRPSISR